MKQKPKNLVPKITLQNSWNDFSPEHSLLDYVYTKQEHNRNKKLYNKIYNDFYDFDFKKINLKTYYKDLKKYYAMAEILLDENIKDIENYLKEIIHLSYQMLYSITDNYFKVIKKDLLKIYGNKNWDYNNAAENQLKYSGIYTFKTILEHKILRLKSFVEKKEIKVKDEKVTDAIKDLINYCMIYLIWARKGYSTLRDITVNIKG